MQEENHNQHDVSCADPVETIGTGRMIAPNTGGSIVNVMIPEPTGSD